MTTTGAMRRKRGLCSSEDGAIAVEAALVLPIFVVMLLGIVDFAQTFFIWNTLQLVVGQASRYVMVQTSIPNPPPGSIPASCQPPAGSAASCAISALATISAQTPGLPSASSSCTGAPTPGQYCVSATCTAASCSLSALYGFKFVGTYTLSGQITVPISLLPD
jgi:Flp pilus assembly protein TadG